jgi:hypothetical protein
LITANTLSLGLFEKYPAAYPDVAGKLRELRDLTNQELDFLKDFDPANPQKKLPIGFITIPK